MKGHDWLKRYNVASDLRFNDSTMPVRLGLQQVNVAKPFACLALAEGRRIIPLPRRSRAKARISSFSR